MAIELQEKPKSPIIIEGFPGFGFVSTIVTEFVIKHLNAKKIGRIQLTKSTPLAAIKNSEVIDPLEVYYDKKSNIVLLRALTGVNGAEWETAGIISELSQQLKAKEVISIEGIASEKLAKEPKVFFHTNQKQEKFQKLKIEKLNNGIVMGVTGVLLLKEKEMPLSCLFVEAHPDMPDSKAAGEIIKILDNYLNLKIDYEPLMKIGQEAEDKIRGLLEQVQQASTQKEKKEQSYLG